MIRFPFSLLPIALVLLPRAEDPRISAGTAADRVTTVVSTRDVAGARAAHAAVGAHDELHVAFGTDGGILIASSRDGGRTFESPRKVASDLVFALGMRRGPRVAATATSVCVAAVGGEKGGGKDGDVLAWTSRDGGRSWKGPARIDDEPGAAREGLFALAAGPGDTLFCTWLDLRHEKTEIYGAASADGGATWATNVHVYSAPSGPVCQCCAPSVVFDANGSLHVMWRNQIDGARDLFVADSNDGGKTFAAARKLGSGTWKLDACPMDGGGLCAGDVLETVWRRDKAVFRCSPPASETMLAEGMQPTIAHGDAGTFVAWIEYRRGALHLVGPGNASVRTVAESAVDPTLVSRWDGRGAVVLVWENEGGIYCSRVGAPSPPPSPPTSGK